MPRIAVSCDFETFVTRRGQSMGRFVLNDAYVRAIAAAGGVAVLLPHQIAGAAAVLRGFDGLVVSGGDFDIPPAMYGQAIRPRCGKVLPERSAFELGLLEQAEAQRLPVLGVCGGMQLLCVHAGGSMFQDASERPHTDSHEQAHSTFEPAHGVLLAADCRLAAAFATREVQVNSTHHQLVAASGSLRVTGRAPDGVIEAVEGGGERFVVGVQWHPELLGGAALAPYRALVAACCP